MFEENDEDTILKMDLLDTIAEERNSMDFIDLRYETDYLFNILKEGCSIGYDLYDYTRLEIGISNAKTSYKLNSDMPIKNRIPFIYGMNYATEFLACCEENKEFKKLSLEQKIDLAIDTYKTVEFDLNLSLKGNDAFYFQKGLVSIINIRHNGNKKKKK